MKKIYRPFLRHPRTTQERRFNCDEDHKKLTRGRRRNLPSAWDDLWIRDKKSWKEKRKQQHHESKDGWCWREFRWKYGDESCQTFRDLLEVLEAGGYWHKSKWECLRWYGPDLLNEG